MVGRGLGWQNSIIKNKIRNKKNPGINRLCLYISIQEFFRNFLVSSKSCIFYYQRADNVKSVNTALGLQIESTLRGVKFSDVVCFLFLSVLYVVNLNFF